MEHLFYEGFSEEVADYHYSKFNYKVPFLNGAIFEPINNYSWNTTDIVLDNDIFSKIFEAEAMEAYTENTNAYNQLFSDKNKYRAIRQKLEDYFLLYSRFKPCRR